MKIAVACSAAALAVGIVIAGPPGSAVANSLTPQDVADRDTPTPEDFTDPDQSTIDESIVDLDQGIDELDKGIEDLESTEVSGDSTVVTLDTDILFDFDSAELSDAAKKKVADLVKDLPTDSEITVDGHTDSKGEDDYNEKLSEDRAEAVAEVLTSELRSRRDGEGTRGVRTRRREREGRRGLPRGPGEESPRRDPLRELIHPPRGLVGWGRIP